MSVSSPVSKWGCGQFPHPHLWGRPPLCKFGLLQTGYTDTWGLRTELKGIGLQSPLMSQTPAGRATERINEKVGQRFLRISHQTLVPQHGVEKVRGEQTSRGSESPDETKASLGSSPRTCSGRRHRAAPSGEKPRPRRAGTSAGMAPLPVSTGQQRTANAWAQPQRDHTFLPRGINPRPRPPGWWGMEGTEASRCPAGTAQKRETAVSPNTHFLSVGGNHKAVEGHVWSAH